MISAGEKIILIVDDLLDNLRILSSTLTGQGFQVRCAKSGAIALMAVQTAAPDLILLDINMPEMDGYEVCQHLKSNQLTRHIPIIFLSALDDVFDKIKAFNVGGADYIIKPFQIEEVLSRIQHQLELQAAKIEIEQLNQNLEQRVEERTAELAKINQELDLEITERKLAELRLQNSEERLESILGSLEDVVWSMTPDHSQIIYINAAVEKIYGYPASSFFENHHLLVYLIHPQDRRRIEEAIHAMLKTGNLREEYRIIHSNQEIRWVSDRSHLVYNADGKVIRIDGIIRDITEQKRTEQQLIHNALHDHLTGLPNRNLFMDRVEEALKYTKRHPDYLFAILFLDLDRFKMINDSLGHIIGDRFLQETAKLLERCLRSCDTVARLGGDEFTVLIHDIHDKKEAFIIADRILHEFSKPISVKDQQIFSSTSIGIVIGNKDYDSSGDLLRDADIAMYRSKELGKGRYTLFDQTMYAQNLKQIQIDRDLHYALERNEFELYYQPIISLETNKIAGFEILIRWHHPEWGLVHPSEFIPIAEDTGLIVEIGDWVLHKACQQLRIWQIKFPEIASLKMSVNLASQQVKEPNFLEKLDRILAENAINSNTLRLEITEGSMIEQGDETIATLEQLKARNIQLSIDDFGQGYSSLSYLHRFPVNTLKIDRTFINQMSLGGQNIEIIRTIIILAHTLGMDVVAEGVETQAQADKLQELGCELSQGYLFSQPLTARNIETKFFL